MATNPYAPPRAAVTDPVNPALPMQKPRQVRWAGFALWASLALGVVAAIAQAAMGAQNQRGGPAQWVVLLVVLVVYASLTALISTGRNWARITFLVLFVIGALPFFFALRQIFAQSAVFGSISVLQLLLQFGALLLIFMKPGALWYRRAG